MILHFLLIRSSNWLRSHCRFQTFSLPCTPTAALLTLHGNEDFSSTLKWKKEKKFVPSQKCTLFYVTYTQEVKALMHILVVLNVLNNLPRYLDQGQYHVTKILPPETRPQLGIRDI